MASQEQPRDIDGPVEPKTIKDILQTVFPEGHRPPPKGPAGWAVSAPKNRYDEVYPGIFLGEVWVYNITVTS